MRLYHSSGIPATEGYQRAQNGVMFIHVVTNIRKRCKSGTFNQPLRAEIHMLAQQRQLAQHRQPAFGTRERIAIIAELNGLERSLLSKFAKTREDIFHTNARQTDFATPRIAIAAAKWAGFPNRNKHTLLLYLKQDSPAHCIPPYVKSLTTKRIRFMIGKSRTNIFVCFA